MVDDKRNNQIDEYRQLLKIEDARKFKDGTEEEEFVKRLKREIGPVYGVAVNQGFGVLENLYFH